MNLTAMIPVVETRPRSAAAVWSRQPALEALSRRFADGVPTQLLRAKLVFPISMDDSRENADRRAHVNALGDVLSEAIAREGAPGDFVADVDGKGLLLVLSPETSAQVLADARERYSWLVESLNLPAFVGGPRGLGDGRPRLCVATAGYLPRAALALRH